MIDVKIAVEMMKKHPPGAIIIPRGTIGRYTEFDACLYQTWTPSGTRVSTGIGAASANNLNKTLRCLRPEDQWVWILGDDHVWDPDLLLLLLNRNVDMVTPHVLRRTTPYYNVVIDKNTGINRPKNYFDGKTGLYELTEDLIGNAGTLVRRRVIDALSDPWFEVGKLSSEFSTTDIWFCKKAMDAGFKNYIDLDAQMGHIQHYAVWPKRTVNGEYVPQLRLADDHVGTQHIAAEVLWNLE